MKKSKWYIVQGESEIGNYLIIKEEKTDLIVASFESIDKTAANRRLVEIQFLVDEYNNLVKELNKK